MKLQVGRRTFVIVATIVVVAYCAGLLWHVQTSPDIGLHCTFAPKVGRVFPKYLRSSGEVDGKQLIGATVRQVGPQPVANWPQFIRALRSLQRKSPADGADPTFVRHGDEDWVEVVLDRDGSPKPISIWCVLGHTPLESTLPALLWLALEFGLFMVGALVYWKRPDNQSAGPFFAMTIAAVGAYFGGYHWTQVSTQPILLTLFVLSALLLPAVSLHFYQVFPRPKSWLERRPRLTLAGIYGLPIAMALCIIAAYFWIRALVRGGATAEEVRQALNAIRTIIFVAFGMAAVWFTIGVASLVHGYFRAVEAIERSQVKWILAGSVLALGPIAYSLGVALFDPLDFVAGGAAWPMFAASAFITVAFTISITRYRLLRLDLMLNSGMVYFCISFLAVLVYYVLVFTGMLIVGQHVIPGPSLGQAFWVSSTALVLLAVLDLIRGRINRSLESLYRRDKHQLDRTLHQLSEAIEHLVEPPTLARHLLDASAELLAVSRGSLFFAEGEPQVFRLAGAFGGAPEAQMLVARSPLVEALQRQGLLTLQAGRDADACQQLRKLGGEIALGLSHEGKILGILILGPKAAGFYQSEDMNLLSALAPIAALALQNVAGRRAIESLNRDLQTKVEKISEQQERILALQRQLMRQSAIELQRRDMPDGTAANLDIVETDLVGSSAVVGNLLDLVHKVAASPSAVLVRGESGTGKELLARAIHDHSARAAKPFVKVHCAALSPTLLESELFGHVKGAFTGAVGDKVGRFETANGGTLFLDEIGDISLDVQVKLLRVLQEKTFERVGSSEPVRVDVRIVAATHQNLERLIQQERFREDLYYRLNVIPITVPPLRQRREDVPELVQHFLRQLGGQTGRPIPELDDDALEALRGYDWPGNIRQLRNVIERTLVVAEGPSIGLSDLPEEVRAPRSAGDLSEARNTARRLVRSSKEQRLKREREELEQALLGAGGNKAEAARALGIPRSTLLSRMQKHGLV